MKTPTPGPRNLGASALDAHPVPTLVVDAGLRIAYVNSAARRLLGAAEGESLSAVFACVEARAPGSCGPAARCAGCAFRRSVERALEGESVRARGFVLRPGSAGAPADLHLLAFASPLPRGGVPLAVLAIYDANALLGDPGVVRVCEGCGRVEDEEGGWHALHRYLEDRLGLESAGALCGECAGVGGGGRSAV